MRNIKGLDPHTKLTLRILNQAVADATAIGRKSYKDFQPGVTLSPEQLEEEKERLAAWVIYDPIYESDFEVFCKYLHQDVDKRRQEILDLLEGK